VLPYLEERLSPGSNYFNHDVHAMHNVARHVKRINWPEIGAATVLGTVAGLVLSENKNLEREDQLKREEEQRKERTRQLFKKQALKIKLMNLEEDHQKTKQENLETKKAYDKIYSTGGVYHER